MIGRQVEQALQGSEGRIGIGDPVGDQVDAEIGAVRRDSNAIAIEHPAAPGRDQRKVDPVAFRCGGVFGILRDREIAEPPGEQQPDTALDSAEQKRPPLERLSQARRGQRQFSRVVRIGHLQPPDRHEPHAIEHRDQPVDHRKQRDRDQQLRPDRQRQRISALQCRQCPMPAPHRASSARSRRASPA